MKAKLSFSRGAVIIMMLAIVGYVAAGFIRDCWPPAEITYCWFGFWTVQAIVTARLQMDKRKDDRRYKEYDQQQTFMQSVVPFINKDNAVALCDRFLGFQPVYREPEMVKEKPKTTANKKTTTKKKTTESK